MGQRSCKGKQEQEARSSGSSQLQVLAGAPVRIDQIGIGVFYSSASTRGRSRGCFLASHEQIQRIEQRRGAIIDGARKMQLEL